VALIALAGLGNYRSPSSTSVSRSSSALTKVSVADRQALLAGLLGSPSKEAGAAATAVPTFTAKLTDILPEHLDGEAALAVHGFLDPTNKDPLQDLFTFACYFFSNSMLSRGQRLAFMKWIMEKNYTQKLAAFLAIPSTSVGGFRHGVIAAIMDMENLQLVILLVRSGVSFGDILAQATGVHNQKFFDNLIEYGLDQDLFRQLSGRIATLIFERATGSADEELLVRLLNAPVSADLLSGAAGGQLLWLVVRKGYLQASKTLIEKGCKLDVVGSRIIDRYTPLGLAVSRGYTNVAKCLIEAGANLSMVSAQAGGYLEEPLRLALRLGRIEIITALVKGGANLDCRISGRDIFHWSSENNARVYRHLCTLTGRDGNSEKPKKATAADIVREADRGSGPFAIFHWENRADLTDQLLEEALEQAVDEQKFDAIATLLSAGVDPNATKTSAGEPPIARTLWLKPKDEFSDPPDDHRILELLLDSGADPNHEGVVSGLSYMITEGEMEDHHFEIFLNGGLDLEKYGPRLLTDATASKATDIMAALLEKGVSPNSYSSSGSGRNALQAAAESGNIDYIDYFLQHGGDINKPASRSGGATALQAACCSNNKQTVRYLLEKGADVNAPPAVRRGITAIEASLQFHQCNELFELLLEHGAAINQTPGQSSRILRRLIFRGIHDQNLLRLVSLTLDAGADSSEMATEFAGYGRTALQLAAEQGSLDLVKLMVSRNGDVNRPAWRYLGRTALQAAVTRHKPEFELVQFLIDHGADVNAAPAANGGLTALQGAAIQGHVKIVLLLLGSGADPNARPALEYGRTALQGAAEHGRLDVVKLLLNAGARPDRWGKQVGFQKEIDLAERNRHFTVAELLRSHETEIDVV